MQPIQTYENKRNNKFSIIVILMLINIYHIQSFSISLNMNTANTSSDANIISYASDIGSCSCNLHNSICDNFCCCDTSCSQSQIQTWTKSKSCKNAYTNLQTKCDSLEQGGFLSFQDLACVYYSNRGNIGYFYNYPEPGSLKYPASNKFASVASSAEAIDVISSSAAATTYKSPGYLVKIKKDSAVKFFQMWNPIAGGNCGTGFLNMSTSGSYACEYALSSSTCAKSSQLYLGTSGTVTICKDGNCNATLALNSTITPSTVNVNSCNGMVTSQSIELTLSSNGQQYTIESANILITQDNIDMTLNPIYTIKTTITINKPANSTSYSGNPGYIMGKSINAENAGTPFTLFDIADGTGNCLNTGVNGSSTPILFGQNVAYSCATATPCNSSLYIDSLAKLTSLRISKWAKGSLDTVLVGGTGSTINTCSSQTIILNILYSSGGWQLDTQNYIIGAQITTKPAIQTVWSKKYLKINWVYASPQKISTPPTNYFYDYFSYLWKPLRQYFGVY